MGRSPCCEKVGLKKGPWTPEEDQKLMAYIEAHGHGSWRALPAKAGLQRCGKSCRLRWTNYLRPDIKRGKFSIQEEQTIIQLHALLGNRWSAIATHLPKRTDNEIKNYWNTHLKKRLTKMGIDPVTHKPKTDAFGATNSKDAANLSHMAQWESARLQAEARLVRESKLAANQLSATFAANKAAAPPPLPCLDVLRAWQTAWFSRPSSSGKDHPLHGGIFNEDLESPTSVLNFVDSTLPAHAVGLSQTNGGGLMTCEGSNNNNNNNKNNNNNNSFGWKSMETIKAATNTMGGIMNEGTTSYGASTSTWVGGENDVEAISNVMDGLSEIFGYETSTLMEANSTVANSGNNVSCSGELEENKNYWNSMLNLVDTSASGSPVF